MERFFRQAVPKASRFRARRAVTLLPPARKQRRQTFPLAAGGEAEQPHGGKGDRRLGHGDDFEAAIASDDLISAPKAAPGYFALINHRHEARRGNAGEMELVCAAGDKSSAGPVVDGE